MVSRDAVCTVKQQTENETSKHEESDRTNEANLNRPVDSQTADKADCQGIPKTGQERGIIVRVLAMTKSPNTAETRATECHAQTTPRIPLLAFRAASNHRPVAARS